MAVHIQHERRWLNEIDYYQSCLLSVLAQGLFKPYPHVTKEEYYAVKKNKHLYEPAYVGFVQTQCSFGAKIWGGYASNKDGRDYTAVANRNLLVQQDKLAGCWVTNLDYRSLKLGGYPSVIYCDPPYRGTTGYSGLYFSNDEFEDWCINLASLDGVVVFVSEYNITNKKFEEVWKGTKPTTMDKNKKDERVEKLYRVRA